MARHRWHHRSRGWCALDHGRKKEGLGSPIQALLIRVFLAGPLYLALWLPIVGIYKLGEHIIQERRRRPRQHGNHAPRHHNHDAGDDVDDAPDHTDPHIFVPPEDAPHA